MFKRSRSKDRTSAPPTPKIPKLSLPDLDGRNTPCYGGRATPKVVEIPSRPASRCAEPIERPSTTRWKTKMLDETPPIVRPPSRGGDYFSHTKEPYTTTVNIMTSTTNAHNVPAPRKPALKRRDGYESSTSSSGSSRYPASSTSESPVAIKSALKKPRDGYDSASESCAAMKWEAMQMTRERSSAGRAASHLHLSGGGYESEFSSTHRHRTTSKTTKDRDLSLPMARTPSSKIGDGYLSSEDCSKMGGRPSSTRHNSVPVYHHELPSKKEHVNLHWQLLPYDGRISKHLLRYNIALPPTEAKFATTHPSRALTKSELGKPAAENASKLTEMIIRCEELPSWTIVVRRSEGINCLDVWSAIYDTLNRTLTNTERARIPPHHLKRLEPAFQKRCREAQSLTAYEERLGFKRVDLLNGKTQFAGLTRPSPDDDWVLHVQ